MSNVQVLMSTCLNIVLFKTLYFDTFVWHPLFRMRNSRLPPPATPASTPTSPSPPTSRVRCASIALGPLLVECHCSGSN